MTRLTKAIFAITGPLAFACAALLAAPLTLWPTPVAAQGSDSYYADDCIAGQQSGSSYDYINSCSYPVLIAYCSVSADRPCKSAQAYSQTRLAAKARTSTTPPESTTRLQRYACKATGELYWVDFAPGSGGNSGYRCRPNAAQRAAAIAAPRPVPATPAPVAGEPGDDAAALNAQQAAAAAAWLAADTEARRIQAEKLADFERRQAEFNRQQADYAQAQAEYRAALAAQQAEVERIRRLNADIDACNRGDRSRCPI